MDQGHQGIHDLWLCQDLKEPDELVHAPSDSCWIVLPRAGDEQVWEVSGEVQAGAVAGDPSDAGAVLKLPVSLGHPTMLRGGAPAPKEEHQRNTEQDKFY